MNRLRRDATHTVRRFAGRFADGGVQILAAAVLALAGVTAQAAGIQSFSPQGEVSLARQARAVFSEPMIRLGDSGAPDAFEVDCTTPGQARWVDPRTWVYTFDAAPRAGSRCTFTLKPALRARSGAALTGTTRFQFSTGGPAIAQAIPYEGSRITEEQAFILALTGPVRADTLTRHAWCRVEGIGERIGVRLLQGPDRDLLVRRFAAGQPDVVVLACARALPADAKLELVWDAGIATPSGVATRQPQVLKYQARSPFSAALSCPRENSSAPCTPLGEVRIEFTSPVPRAAAQAVRLRFGDGERKPVIDDSSDATVDSVSFKGPQPESADFTVVLPRDLRDADQRPLVNADLFPLKSRTAAYPPLAKFAAAPFGIIELDGAPAMPLTLRRVERSLLVRGAEPGREPPAGAAPARGTVRDLTVQDDAQIIEWYSRLVRLHERDLDDAQARSATGLPPAPRRQAAPRRNEPVPTVQSRTLSLLAREPAARLLQLPEPAAGGDWPFEVVGVPLPDPGFHVLEIESRKLGRALLDRDANLYVRTAALVTNLAVHYKRSAENALVWVTRLDRGKPVAGADVRISDCRGQPLWRGTTDAQGIARVPGPLAAPAEDCGDDRPGHFVSARARDAQGRQDLSFAWSGWSQGIEPWRFDVPVLYTNDDRVAAHTVFDRVLVRAGETVSMKHFVRATTSSGLARPPDAILPTQMKIVHTGSEQSWQVPLTWQGGAAPARFRLPPGARLGRYEVFLDYGQDEPAATAPGTPAGRPRSARLWSGTRLSGSFRVEAFRLPVFDARIALPAVLPAAPREASADVRISWLSGGPAAKLPVKVSAQMSPQAPSFDGWEAFSFQRADLEREDGDDPDTRDEPTQRSAALQRLAVRGIHRDRLVLDKRAAELDAQGSARVTVGPLPTIAVPHRLQVETTFADPSGEIQSVTSSALMYPSRLLVGVKTDGWAAAGESVGLRVAVLDTAGRPQPGRTVRVMARLERTLSHRKRLVGGFYAYENQRQSRDLGEVCKARTEAGGVALCEIAPRLAPGETGELVLIAQADDDEARTASASASVWMAGRGELWFDAQAQDRIDLIPEKKRLAPGETARLQVRMPFRQATALLTIEREGIVDSRVIELSGRNPVIEVPMRAEYGPNVFVSVLPIRGRLREVPWYSLFTWGWRQPIDWWQSFRHTGEVAAARLAPTATVDLARPAFRMGLTELSVGIDGSRLAVRVNPEREQYRVREKVKVNIDVRLPDGSTPAAGAQVALAAVDEALLELMPNGSWKVLEAMLQRRSLGVETATAQMQVVGRRHFGRKAVAAGGDGGRNPTRELFDTLLYWNPTLTVDAQGRAQVEVPLNDSLTRFRIVAIANAGEGFFGTGEAMVRSHQPLQLVAGLPLVVRDGDSLPVALTVRNNTDQPMKVSIGARVRAGTDKGAEVASLQREVALAPGAAQALPLPLVVPGGVEALVWDIEASEPGGQRDRLRVRQAVAPAVPRSVRQAMLMQIDGQAEIALASVPGALADRSALRVSLSSSIAGSLAGVNDWLTRYPYQCLEQRVSRAVGLADAAQWQTLVEELPAYLDSDGLAQFFPVGEGQRPAGSEALTAYLLAVSREAGVTLPAAVRERMLGALAAFVEGRLRRDGWSLRPDSLERRLAALAVLARHGRAPMAQVAALNVAAERLPLSSVLDWTTILEAVPGLPRRDALLAQADQILRARLVASGTRLMLAGERDDEPWWLLSNSDAAMARLLLHAQSRAGWRDDTPRLAAGLLARQRQGAWSTTTANAWGAVAIRGFAARFESARVDGRTTVVLGGASRTRDWADRGSGAGTGDSAPFDLPQPEGNSQARLTHAGAGRPWLQAQVLAAVPLTQAVTSGYRIQRTTEAIERRDPGNWSRGDLVRVRVTVDGSAPMPWVVIADPLPPGATVLGSGLARDTGIVADAPAAPRNASESRPTPTFVERQAASVQAYFERLGAGRQVFEYVIRLNQPGEFRLPPTRVEAMYAPDVFGELPNALFMVKP
jgi:uncharacterized protein YfaS (alpha-2-macroglobulin family)